MSFEEQMQLERVRSTTIILAAIIQASNGMLIETYAKKAGISTETFLAYKAIEQTDALYAMLNWRTPK